MRLLLALLLLAGRPPSPVPTASWRVGATAYRYDPQGRRLTATCGHTTFEPLAGFGPRFLLASKERSPAEARITLLGAARAGQTLTATYRAEADGDHADYTLTIAPGADGLRITVSSPTTRCVTMQAGRTRGLGPWFRLSYTRNAEPYGQPWWPRVAWAPVDGVCVSAAWDMAASSGTSWVAPDQRFQGTGDFAAGLDVAYVPRTDGERRPLHETLTLRVSRDLWRAVPPPPGRPSPYARDLARSVFLDVWGGTAAETEAFLRHLATVTQGRARFYAVFENWETGGFDALLPDSIRMPDYPPNEGIGTVAALQGLSRTARAMGRFALRTNYMVLRAASPSAREGRAAAALDADGKPKWHTRPTDWLPLARRQEEEIHRLFATDAGFTDQLTSGGAPWSYADFSATALDGVGMGAVLAKQRALAALISAAHGGPVGSETGIDEQLLGQWVATGDFGIFDGYHRAFTPEFKLRRLQTLSTFHGMGLMYRYFEMPPFPAFSAGKTTYLADAAQYDDYRAGEVLYGNGGYLFYYPGMPWDYVMTECLVVGTLQRHYALQPVRSVAYWGGGRWQSLQQIVAAGVNPLPLPWDPQPDCLKRVRVAYASGLTIVVNRLPEVFAVSTGREVLRLPRSGWVAWTPDGKLLAYSAYAPGTDHRVDYIRDAAQGLQYVNPRGATVLGQDRPCLWLDGRPVVKLDPKTGDAWIRGRMVPYRPPVSQPARRLDFSFARDAQGWVAQSGLGPLRIVDGALTAEIVGEDPYLVGPPIDLAPDTVREVVVRMRVTCGTFGQLYFQAEGVKATGEEMCVHFPVRPGPAVQEIRIPVGEHPLWRGHRITWLRLDPEHGASPGSVAIEAIRGE